eukprot:SAG22_NODE_536_length_9364_cov_15.973988_5_plen_98_part_00
MADEHIPAARRQSPTQMAEMRRMLASDNVFDIGAAAPSPPPQNGGGNNTSAGAAGRARRPRQESGERVRAANTAAMAAAAAARCVSQLRVPEALLSA